MSTYNEDDLLNEASKEKLKEEPVSQLDLYYVSRNVKDLREGLQGITNVTERNSLAIEQLTNLVQDSMFVKVRNGNPEPKERPVKELIGELWELTLHTRNRSKLMKLILTYKTQVVISLILGIILIGIFNKEFLILYDFVLKNLGNIAKSIL